MELFKRPCRALALAKAGHFSPLTFRYSKARAVLFVVAITFVVALRILTAQVDEAPYFGDWENDRGDTLQIASDSIKVNTEKPVRYDDITEDSDETFFVLQIKDSSESSYFGGNFLRITFVKDPDHFTMFQGFSRLISRSYSITEAEWSSSRAGCSWRFRLAPKRSSCCAN